MADDVVFQPTVATPASGTVIATEDVGGVHHQKVKVEFGGDGVATLVENTAPFPVIVRDSSGNEVSIGGGTQYDEDTAHVSGDKVTMAGVVRRDTAASSAGTDGDRTVLAVDASGRLHVNGSGVTQPVSVASLPLPTGAATEANQATIIGHVDGIEAAVDGVEGLLTTIDADTSALAGTVVGTELQVDVVTSALPTGAATLAEQQTQTTALEVIDDLVQTEDVAHSTGAAGAMALAVRRDANTTLVDTDGDYAPLQVNADGSLKVAITAGAGSGGTSATDDAAFTAGAGSGTPMMGFATADAVDAGDVGVVAMTTARALHVSQQGTVTVDGSGVTQPVSAASLPLPTGASTAANQTTIIGHLDGVEGLLGTIDADTGAIAASVATVAGAVSGTEMQVDVVTSALPTGAATAANQATVIGHVDGIETLLGTIDADTSALAGAVAGTEVQVDVVAPLPAGTNNIGDVDVLSLPSLPAGTNNIGDVDVLTLPNVTLAAGTNTNEVVGDVAEDAALAGNPVRVGVRASAALPTAMSADGDVVTPYADLRGRLVTTAKAGTATLSNVSGSASSVTVLAANTGRLGAIIYNDSAAVLYLKMGATASTTSFSYLVGPGATLEIPFGYTGVLDGIWASATGAARVTELT